MRALVWLVALYVVCDLSLAAMPGAFVFDPDGSVETARGGRDRSIVVDVPLRVPAPPTPEVTRTLAPVPPRLFASRRLHRLPRSTIPSPARVAGPAPASEDSH